MSKMNAYLVSSSRFETYLHKRIFFAAPQGFVVSYGFLTVLSYAAQNYGFGFSCNGSVYSSEAVRAAVYRRVIDLRAVSLKNICAVSVFCRDAQSGCIAVKSVYRTEREFGIKRGKIISKGISLMLDGRVNRHISRLIENDKIFIFVSNRNVKRRIRFKETRIVVFQQNNVSGINRVDASDGRAAAGNASVDSFKLCQKTPRNVFLSKQKILKRHGRICRYNKLYLIHGIRPPS